MRHSVSVLLQNSPHQRVPSLAPQGAQAEEAKQEAKRQVQAPLSKTEGGAQLGWRCAGPEKNRKNWGKPGFFPEAFLFCFVFLKTGKIEKRL